MIAKLKRCLSLFLVLMLLTGSFPHVNAAEVTEPTMAEQSEETEAVTEPTDTTEPTEPTEPTVPEGENDESLTVMTSEEPVTVPDEYGIMPLASTQSGIPSPSQPTPQMSAGQMEMCSMRWGKPAFPISHRNTIPLSAVSKLP